MHYRILHSSTDRRTCVRTIIGVGGAEGQRIYRRERYQLRHDQPLLTDASPCIERAWGTDGERFDLPTEEEALAASLLHRSEP